MSTIELRHITDSIYQYLPIHQPEGYTVLLVASCAGHVEVVKLLLDRGADIQASCDVSASIWNHTLDSTQPDQTLCEDHSAMVTTR